VGASNCRAAGHIARSQDEPGAGRGSGARGLLHAHESAGAGALLFLTAHMGLPMDLFSPRRDQGSREAVRKRSTFVLAAWPSPLRGATCSVYSSGRGCCYCGNAVSVKRGRVTAPRPAPNRGNHELFFLLGPA
jgi:hypothetical protein